MNINYSVPQNVLVNDDGEPLQAIPELSYGDHLDVVFTARDGNNDAVDLSSAVTWEFAIDLDRTDRTLPLCSTSSITYDTTAKTLSCSVSARTLIFLEAVNGKSQVALIAEMSGFDGSGNRIYRFPWNMTGVMPVDANETVPEESSPVVVQNTDFTAFRVYADDTDDHTQTYPIGSYCPQFVPENILFRHEATADMPEKLQELYQETENPTVEQIRNALGYIGGRAIPKSMTERFVLLAGTDWANSDVVVDWGDGTKSFMKNGKTQVARGIGFYDNNEYVDDWCDSHYMFSHTYEQEGSYYIKITGKDYWGIRHYYADLKNADGTAKYPDNSVAGKTIYNLVYDCMGPDTPIAGCVRNLASFMNGSSRLLHVLMTEITDKTRTIVCNWTGMFLNCANLVSARGIYFAGYNLTGTQTFQQFFQGCVRLETFVGSVPAYCTSILGYRYMFSGCAKLRTDIASIIPGCGFLSRRVRAIEIFKDCSSLTGTVPADLLWNDTGIIWSDTANAFSGCSAAIRAQVPVSWGGTMAEE